MKKPLSTSVPDAGAHCVLDFHWLPPEPSPGAQSAQRSLCNLTLSYYVVTALESDASYPPTPHPDHPQHRLKAAEQGEELGSSYSSSFLPNLHSFKKINK